MEGMGLKAHPDEEAARKKIYPPLIDLAPFASTTSTTTTTTQQQVALQVQRACIEVGFFQVRSPSLSQHVIDEGFQATRDFFNLPLAVKQSASAFNSPLFRGYQGSDSDSHSCTPEEAPTTSTPTPTPNQKDLKESFTIGAEGHHSSMHGPNNWPTTVSKQHTLLLRSIQSRLQQYQHTMMNVALETAQALALSLGLPLDFFSTNMSHAVAQMVLLKYPPPLVANARPGCSAHKDCGFLTLLVQEHSQGGLEIYSDHNQEWINVPQLDACVLINLGDLASEWTNHYYKSTLHRVNNSKLTRDRHSVPFFCNLNYDALVDPNELCAQSTLSEVVAGIKQGHDEPGSGFMKKITAGDYICQKLGLMHDNGKGEGEVEGGGEEEERRV